MIQVSGFAVVMDALIAGWMALRLSAFLTQSLCDPESRFYV